MDISARALRYGPSSYCCDFFCSTGARRDPRKRSLSFCVEGREGSRERDVCTALILGLLKGLDYDAMNLTKNMCFANYVSPTQAELVVKKFMTDHPEWLGYDAGMVATMALTKAFGGCQPK
jgi:hypothetical protein